MKKSTVRKVKKAAQSHKVLFAVIVGIIVVLIIAAVVLYITRPPFIQPVLKQLGLMEDDDNGGNGGNSGDLSTDPNANTAAIISSDLSIHFLELGVKNTGDCTLIKCGDTEVLIDAGAKRESSSTISAYLSQYCTDGKLEYVISTHAHEDHIAGFAGGEKSKDGILYEYSQNGKSIGTIIQFTYHNTTSKIYADYCSAVEFAQANGTAVYTADQCYDEKDGAKRQYFLDANEKISINILYSYYYYNTVSSGENNYSVVTLLTEEYSGGKRNYLFTGDMEDKGESKLVDYYKKVPDGYKTDYNVLPEVELYKAGHHGSKTSSTEKLISVIKPKAVAICCCCGSPEYTSVNDNTFPTQTVINTLSRYTDKIYVTSLATNVEVTDGKVTGDYGFTSMNGNIVFYSTGGELKLWCSNNAVKLKDTDWFKANRTWPTG